MEVELDGIETAEGKDAYKLKLTSKEGREFHVWSMQNGFLEIKVEGNPRRLDGKLHPVEVYYRDYRTVSEIQIPFVIETRSSHWSDGARIQGSSGAAREDHHRKGSRESKTRSFALPKAETTRASNR
jgi:hypothetical protein